MTAAELDAMRARAQAKQPRVVLCPVCKSAPASNHYMGANEYTCGRNWQANADLSSADLDREENEE